MCIYVDAILFLGVSGAYQWALFTRWGRNSCPSTNGTELVYAGRAGGTQYDIQGGGFNILCLPEDPNYLADTAGISGSSTVWGAEYEFNRQTQAPHSNLQDHNVPCAVCFTSTRTSVLTIPVKTQCASSWTREYNGYLTAALDGYYHSSFECVDRNPESVPGSSSDDNNVARVYYADAVCDQGLACPPYQSRRILSCTVCTK